MSGLSPEQRVLRARLAAHTSWANTDDRAARTQAARDRFNERFLREADPDGLLPESERQRRADQLRRAYFARLQLKSSQARRRRKGDLA